MFHCLYMSTSLTLFTKLYRIDKKLLHNLTSPTYFCPGTLYIVKTIFMTNCLLLFCLFVFFCFLFFCFLCFSYILLGTNFVYQKNASACELVLLSCIFGNSNSSSITLFTYAFTVKWLLLFLIFSKQSYVRAVNMALFYSNLMWRY